MLAQDFGIDDDLQFTIPGTADNYYDTPSLPALVVATILLGNDRILAVVNAEAVPVPKVRVEDPQK